MIDKKYANLVNKKTCSLVAKKLSLSKYILLGTSQKRVDRSSDKINSDCLEALIGAIYIDGGLKSAEKLILKFWEDHILKSTITLIDSKTKLQEFSLKSSKNYPSMFFQKKQGLNTDLYLKQKSKYQIQRK